MAITISNHGTVFSFANATGTVSNGSTAFSDAGASPGFTSTLLTNFPNLGIVGAGAVGADLHTTGTFVSSTACTLANAAGTGVTTANWAWGSCVCDTNSAGATLVRTWTSAITAGDCLVIGLLFDPSVTVSSITDTSGNTYTLQKSVNPGGGISIAAIYVAQNVAAVAAGVNVTTVTFSANPFAGGLNGAYVDSYEATPSVGFRLILDAAATVSNTGTGTALSSGSITPTYPSEVLLAYPASETTITGGAAGWTVSAVNPYAQLSEFLVQTTAASATATFTGAVSHPWGVVTLGIGEIPLVPVMNMAVRALAYPAYGPLTGLGKLGTGILAASATASTSTVTPSSVESLSDFSADTIAAGASQSGVATTENIGASIIAPAAIPSGWSDVDAVFGTFSLQPLPAPSPPIQTRLTPLAFPLGMTVLSHFPLGIGILAAPQPAAGSSIQPSGIPYDDGLGAFTVSFSLTVAGIETVMPFGANAASGMITSAIASLESFGSDTAAMGVTSTVSNSEVFGADSNAGNLTTGVPPIESFGAEVIQPVLTMQPASIAADDRFGSLSASGGLISSVAAYEAFGGDTPSVGITSTVASLEVLGADVVRAVIAVTPAGIATEERFGSGTSFGSITATIASGEVFGVDATVPVVASSVLPSESFGAEVLLPTVALTPSSIVSVEPFGAFNSSSTISSAIASSELFGAAIPSLRMTSAIAGQELFGASSAMPTIAITPASIASEERFGSFVTAISVSSSIFPAGIEPIEAFGTMGLAFMPGPTVVLTVVAIRDVVLMPPANRSV